MLSLMSLFSPLHLFILTLEPFLRKKSYFFPQTFGILSKGATIVLTNMTLQPVQVVHLFLCRVMEKTQEKTVLKIIKIWHKMAPYCMCWRKKRQAQTTRFIRSNLQHRSGRRPWIARSDQPWIARPPEASASTPRCQAVGRLSDPRAGGPPRPVSSLRRSARDLARSARDRGCPRVRIRQQRHSWDLPRHAGLRHQSPA